MAALVFVLHTIIRIFIFALLVRAIISWVAPMNRHPAVILLTRITDPPLEPIRNVIGIRNGVDVSPLVLMIILYVVDAILIGLLP